MDKKYAQPCKGGMYMGIVNVYLHNRIHNDMRFSGDGRIYKNDANETRTEWLDSTPKVCKYIKITTSDKPENAPLVIEFDFDIFKYSKNGTIYTDAARSETSYDEEMGKEENYTKYTAKIMLNKHSKLDNSDNYFFRYIFEKTEGYNAKVTTQLATDNKYIFEFQMLNAHPKMPGLFFASSVGHPSDRLAVLLGGQARPTTNSKNNTALNDDFFVQYKFDNMQWYKLKIVHAAMANVLSKVEYLYNYVLEIPFLVEIPDYVLEDLNPTSNLKRQKMTKRLCHTVLDHITKPYIDAVLQNMELVRLPEGEPMKISKIREVCEYVFLKEYRFLNTLHWKQVDGICTLSDRFELDGSESNVANIRAIAYKVVSPVSEQGQINVFSAHDVFSAYVQRWHADAIPGEFTKVLEDAKQLALNMKYLKTSSNFALVRLRQSCASAFNVYPDFKWICAYMLEASKNFISLLMQEHPSALHQKFWLYMQTTRTHLRRNELSKRIAMDKLEDADNFIFNDTESYEKDAIEIKELEYLVLARQLHVLAGMRRAENDGIFEVDKFLLENCFSFK